MRLLNVIYLPFIITIIATALPTDHQVTLQLVEKAPNTMNVYSSDRRPVPGDSPAFYVGDPSNDILSIDALNLLPNPPVDAMTLQLRGKLNFNVGDKARIKLTVALNGTVGPSVDSDLCAQRKIEITQNGTRVCSLKSGPIEMSYSVVIPYVWLPKGNYTVHTQMNTADGARMTGFEGTVWINGEAGDGWAPAMI